MALVDAWRKQSDSETSFCSFSRFLSPIYILYDIQTANHTSTNENENTQPALSHILEPQDQEIRKLREVQERPATDFEAPKLWKGPPGSTE